MSNEITYTNADQPTINAAHKVIMGAHWALRNLRVDGKYGASFKLKPEARKVIEDAVAYFEQLGEEIGADTQLGSCGSPAIWVKDFTRELSNLS